MGKVCGCVTPFAIDQLAVIDIACNGNTTDIRDRILFLTAGIVLLTILVNGTTCKHLLNYLGECVASFYVLSMDDPWKHPPRCVASIHAWRCPHLRSPPNTHKHMHARRQTKQITDNRPAQALPRRARALRSRNQPNRVGPCARGRRAQARQVPRRRRLERRLPVCMYVCFPIPHQEVCMCAAHTSSSTSTFIPLRPHQLPARADAADLLAPHPGRPHRAERGGGRHHQQCTWLVVRLS